MQKGSRCKWHPTTQLPAASLAGLPSSHKTEIEVERFFSFQETRISSETVKGVEKAEDFKAHTKKMGKEAL